MGLKFFKSLQIDLGEKKEEKSNLLGGVKKNKRDKKARKTDKNKK